MKKCSTCKIIKEFNEFHNNKNSKDGKQGVCKPCEKSQKIKYRGDNIEEHKNYRLGRRDELLEYLRIYASEHKEEHKIYLEENKEYIREWDKQYRILNKKERLEYIRNRRLCDPLYKLKCNIRCSIYNSLRNAGFIKSSKTQIILCMNFIEFKLYLESKFESWMTWDNYGLYNGELNYGWDLDHIIPLSSAKTEEDVLKLNHFSNFQPLCSKVNRDIKRNKLDY